MKKICVSLAAIVLSFTATAALAGNSQTKMRASFDARISANRAALDKVEADAVASRAKVQAQQAANSAASREKKARYDAERAALRAYQKAYRDSH